MEKLTKYPYIITRELSDGIQQKVMMFTKHEYDQFIESTLQFDYDVLDAFYFVSKPQI